MNGENWMAESFEVLKGKRLNDICVPGTHHSGLNIDYSTGTAFAWEGNTRCQAVPVLKQLELGARFLDIRPMISGGHFLTGHYSYTGIPFVGWQGANGESINIIVADTW